MIEKDTIDDIIRERNILTLFQPIINLKDKRIIGFEALTRGICSTTGTIIRPMELFSKARAAGRVTEFDRLCRKNALTSFKDIPNYSNYILFLNMDTTAIELNDPDVKRVTKEYTEELGIDYSSISLEIVESKIENEASLSEFVEHYKKLGYYVSLDDFGAMHSNMNRIAISKPDIIKIDMELINNVHNNYYQQAILSSIISLAKKTGALTLAEGLENPEDILTCYELGIDLFQGFYFFRPCVDIFTNFPFITEKIEYIVEMIKRKLAENILVRKNQHSNFDYILNMLNSGTKGKNEEEYISYLKKQIKTFTEIERIFILDSEGHIKFEATNDINITPKKQKSFMLRQGENSDHSLKDYFYYLDKISSDRFYSETYLSGLTSSIVRIMSCKISLDDEACVLCVEFLDKLAPPSEKYGETITQ